MKTPQEKPAWGLGFGVWGLGVDGLGFKEFSAWVLRGRGQGRCEGWPCLEFRVSGFRASAFGWFGVSGLRVSARGLGLRV